MPAGRVSDQAAVTMDWAATILAAARVGRFKLVADGEFLYDLGVDLGEKTDSKARDPARLVEPEQRYSAWAEMLLRPT